MKHAKLIVLLFAAITIAGTGCLKDKGFDNHDYGINDPDASPAGVGFNLGIKFAVNTGVVLSSATQDVPYDATLISLLTGKVPSSDVHVKVQVDPTLVSDYNTDNGTSLIDLDPALYSIVEDVVIPAGSLNGPVKITVPDASALDPNLQYALGLKIVSADAGYTIAGNEQKIVLIIAIKNAYDGDYHSTGYFYHPSGPRGIDRDKTLGTVNATTVRGELGDLGGSGYTADFDVDGSNHVTITAAPGAAGAPYMQWDSGLPTNAPGPAYTPQWPGSSDCNNTWDPSTSTFKVRYGYIGGTGFRISEEFMVRQ